MRVLLHTRVKNMAMVPSNIDLRPRRSSGHRGVSREDPWEGLR